MTTDISASLETLVEQAPMVVSLYLSEARNRIDDQFGEGFAEKHPLLTCMFVLAAAIEGSIATLAQQIRAGLSTVATEIGYVSLPEIAKGVQSLAEATESVASAIEST